MFSVPHYLTDLLFEVTLKLDFQTCMSQAKGSAEDGCLYKAIIVWVIFWWLRCVVAKVTVLSDLLVAAVRCHEGDGTVIFLDSAFVS